MGGKSGVPHLPCSIVLTWLWVAALWCAAVVLSSLSSLSGSLFSLSSLLPSLSLFSLKRHNFSLCHFSETAAASECFSSFVVHLNFVWRVTGLPSLYTFCFYSTEIQNHNSKSRATSFRNYCDWFPCSFTTKKATKMKSTDVV